jgi:hypothetical protein
MKIGRGNRSTWRKPAPAPLCPPQIPLDQTWDRTQAASVGSQLIRYSWYAKTDSDKVCEPEHYNKLTHRLMTNKMIKKTKQISQSDLSDTDFSNENLQIACTSTSMRTAN